MAGLADANGARWARRWPADAAGNYEIFAPDAGTREDGSFAVGQYFLGYSRDHSGSGGLVRDGVDMAAAAPAEPRGALAHARHRQHGHGGGPLCPWCGARDENCGGVRRGGCGALLTRTRAGAARAGATRGGVLVHARATGCRQA
jgi:hypothetical protein